VSFDGPMQGSALATDVAVSHGAFAAAAALVRAGAPVAADALRNIDGQISPELTQRAAGQRRRAERVGHRQVRGMRRARERAPDRGGLHQGGHRRAARLHRERDTMLLELEDDAGQDADGGAYGHYLGQEGLADRIEHLQTFRL
jgi:hypothetical protein